MTTQAHWRKVYETKSSTAVSWYQPEAKPSLEAIAKLGAAKSTAFIDIGGGASTLVDALIAAGWSDITVLDIAESALTVARERLGPAAQRVHWIAADITDWVSPRRYHIWHDRAVFHFLTEPAQRAAYRAALEAGLERSGHVIMATFAPDGPEKCSGLPVMRHDGTSLQRELGSGFRLVETWPQTHITPSGNVQKFNWAIFRRV